MNSDYLRVEMAVQRAADLAYVANVPPFSSEDAPDCVRAAWAHVAGIAAEFAGQWAEEAAERQTGKRI